MKKEMTVTYTVDKALYINVTNRLHSVGEH